MSKTIIDGVTLDATGGSSPATTGTFDKIIEDNVAIRLSGDGNTSDVTINLSGVKVNGGGSNYATPETSEEHANVDASANTDNEAAMRFVEVDGYGSVELTVTNNAGSQTVISVDAEGYSV